MTTTKDSGAGVVGFLLGFILGLIGVLIAYAIRTPEKDGTTNAWIGFAISTIILLIVIAA